LSFVTIVGAMLGGWCLGLVLFLHCLFNNSPSNCLVCCWCRDFCDKFLVSIFGCEYNRAIPLSWTSTNALPGTNRLFAGHSRRSGGILYVLYGSRRTCPMDLLFSCRI
jgi:hypothetical protein